MDRQTKGILLIAAAVIVLCGRHVCGIAKTTDGKPRTDLWLHTRR
jgi:hypothetical protein